MKAYKGFNRDMTCRAFQYEEGKTYEEEEAKLCSKGFHACENPLDTFAYYSPAKSVYHLVELDNVSDERESNDTKVCAKRITIGARLDIAGICKAHFDYVSSKCVSANGRVAGDGESAAAGDRGSAAAGYGGSAAAGYRGSAAAGDRGSAAAGYGGSAAAGKYGIACAMGGSVKGGIGCVIVSSELDDYGRNVSIAAAIVDGENIKADTWYKCENGKLVKA